MMVRFLWWNFVCVVITDSALFESTCFNSTRVYKLLYFLSAANCLNLFVSSICSILLRISSSFCFSFICFSFALSCAMYSFSSSNAFLNDASVIASSPSTTPTFFTRNIHSAIITFSFVSAVNDAVHMALVCFASLHYNSHVSFVSDSFCIESTLIVSGAHKKYTQCDRLNLPDPNENRINPYCGGGDQIHLELTIRSINNM
eukprot:469661_1